MYRVDQSPAELLEINRRLEGIFKRYNINTLDKNPLDHAVGNPKFLIEILKGLSDPESFDVEEFEKFSNADLVDFLMRSHHYYSFKKIPEIKMSIKHLLDHSDSGVGILNTILNVFEEFVLHLNKHFKEEEEQLFSIALMVEKRPTTSDFKSLLKEHVVFETHKIQHEVIQSYNHMDLLTKYLSIFKPSNEIRSHYNILLEQLENLKLDLELHEWVEDAVLIPRVKNLVRFEGIKAN